MLGTGKRIGDPLRYLAVTAVVAFVVAVLLVDPKPAQPRQRKQVSPVHALHTHCPWTKAKVREHRQAVWSIERRLGAVLTRKSTIPVVGCGYAKWVENVWWRRQVALAKKARYRILPDTKDWETAVNIVQRVYPGTRSWLLSCSSAEGGHGEWVWYGGRRWTGHHIGNDYLGMDTVAGWLQFRFSTFDPYSRGAFTDTRRKGFVVPRFEGRYGAWLSPLGQALTGGYMRFNGLDGHHWSASFGRGC